MQLSLNQLDYLLERIKDHNDTIRPSLEVELKAERERVNAAVEARIASIKRRAITFS